MTTRNMFFPGCILIIETLLMTSGVAETFYRGSVVDFHSDPSHVDWNLKNFTVFIYKAKEQKSDIIVFPEMGLFSSLEGGVTVPDPKDKVTPWKDENENSVMHILSKAAYNSSIYVVVNLIEKFSSGSSTLTYNTNVVFDKNGTVIARYRKFNLYGIELEKFNKTEKPDIATFQTDFGVKFGIFTCFDILFYYPALELVNTHGVSDIVFPTAWFSELPFLTAIQEQASWSFGTGVNLLASGINNVKQGSSGSGIYAGENGKIVAIMSEVDKSRLLTANINKKDRSSIQSSNLSPKIISSDDSGYNGINQSLIQEGLKIKVEDLSIFETALLTPLEDNKIEETRKKIEGIIIKTYSLQKKICQRSLCCHIKANVSFTFVPQKPFDDNYLKGDDFSLFRYRFAIFDGVRDFTGTTGGIQTCGIIPCLDETIATCGLKPGSSKVKPLIIEDKDLGKLQLNSTLFKEIYINGNFNASNSFISPNVLIKGAINLFGDIPGQKELIFTKSTTSAKLSNATLNWIPKKTISLITAAIYSRLFDRDGEPVSKPTNSTNQSITTNNVHIFLIGIVLIFGSHFLMN